MSELDNPFHPMWKELHSATTPVVSAFQNVVKRIDFRIAASDVAQCHYNLRSFTAHRRGFHLRMALAEQETLNVVSYEKRGNVFTRCPLQRNPYVIQFSR